MRVCRIFSALSAAVALGLALAPSIWAAESDRESKLFGAVSGVERILIATPQHKNAVAGLVDIPPGGQFIVEIQRALRGPGSKSTSVMVINGGSEKQHPKYINGKSYVFLLKKNPDGKGWINQGASEIPIKDGKVQYLVDGKVVEEVVLDEFEDFAVRDAQPVSKKTATRESLTGKWLVATSNKGMNLYLWLVEFTGEVGKGDEGQHTIVKLLSSSKVMQAATLKSSEISQNDVHLVFEGDGTSLDFRGRFENGIVRGNVALGRAIVTPAWMEPTQISNMRTYDSPVRDPAQEEFADAAGQDNATGALARFIHRHPDSTLSPAAYQELVSLAADDKLDREKFEKLAGEFVAAARRWGPRIELQASIDVGAILSRKEHLPDLALEYLNAAAGHFDDDTPIESKKTVGIERGKRLIAAGQETAGVAALAKVREEFPFDAEVVYALARQAEKDNRVDDALAHFGELLVLPQLEQALIESQKSSGRKLPADQYPRRIVSRLWTQQHGDTKGLPAWLNELYETRLRSIATDKLTREVTGSTRVVLCELFTGATGGPSVAADAALAALEGASSKSEVIVVRYHVNVPAADPLANDENQERFKMYNGATTPLLLVDGRFLPAIAGGISETPVVYRRLRSTVETALKDKIDLSLEMSVKADKGQIAIAVKAQGLKTFPSNTRLQIVLAEDKVEFAASNGIRFHEMLARSMPGGVAGVAPVQGVLSFKGEVDISKLKRQLARQLAKAEMEAEAPFDAKPLELQSLHLVAYIQNGETGEVLQAASMPVMGGN
jgi:hypothetical protein